MKYILAFLAFPFVFFLFKFRESIGNSIGDQKWMSYVGGPYNLVVIIGVLIAFWAVATLTGTEELFFKPILWMIPGFMGGGVNEADIPVDTW